MKYILQTLSILLIITESCLLTNAQDQSLKKVNVKGVIAAGEDGPGIKKGEPLVGVTIILKGSTKGTTTDIDGAFFLNDVEVGTTLLVSYIGYDKQEIKVTETTSDLTIALKSETNVLDEVVAVGYGVQRKSDVTGAVSSVDERTLKMTVQAGIDQALQGKVAGVTVTQPSGSAGAEATVNIRGLGSINGGSPLYIIDGIPLNGGITNINPNDIERMEVLKDASAAAIYGSRAANGVIVITTKTGKQGKPVFEYETVYGVDEVWRKLDVLDANGFKNYMQSAYTNANKAVPNAYKFLPQLNTDLSQAEQAYALNPTNTNKDAVNLLKTDILANSLQANTNWQNEVFRKGVVRQHNLSVRGGTEKATYNVSLGYYGQAGTMKKNDFERFSLRINAEVKPKKWLTIGEKTFIVRQERTFGGGNEDGTGVLEKAARSSPLIPINASAYYPLFGKRYVDSAYIGGYAGSLQNISGANDGFNSLATLQFTNQHNTNNRVQSNIYAEIEPISGLKFRTAFAPEITSNNDVIQNDRYFTSNAPGRSNQSKSISDSRSFAFNYTFNNVLTYTRKIGVHDFSALAGHEAVYIKSDFTYAVGSGMPDLINSIGASKGNIATIYAGITERALLSYFGRLNYSFKDLIFATFNVRYDGSSIFGKNNKFGAFPGGSVGVKINNIGPLKEALWLNELKLRASLGILGSQVASGGDYPGRVLIENNAFSYVSGNQQLPAYAIKSGYANPDLRWESIVQYNIGVDFAVLQNALQLTLEYFNKTSKDMIIPYPYSVINGPIFAGNGDLINGNLAYNKGGVINQGVEASLTYRGRAGKLSYSISPNIVYVDNKVINLTSKETIISSNGLTRTQLDGPIGAFYGFVVDKVITSSADTVGYKDEFSSGYERKLGDLKFKDSDPDGKITDKDRKIIGNPIPRVTYGLNARLEYSGFDFTMFFQGVQGRDIYNNQRAGLESFIAPGGSGPVDANQLTTANNAWTPQNPGSDIPAVNQNSNALNNRPSDRWVENGSYLRLKTLQLGYSIPEKSLKKMFRTEDKVSFRVYIAAQNLITITSYKGYDPELIQNSNNDYTTVQTAIDNGNYPSSRRYMVGLQLSF